MKYKAVITDYVWPNLDIETKILNDNDIEVVDCNTKNDEELKKELIDADAILFCFRDINDDIILQIGQLVKHKKFGIGKIQDLDGSKAVVDFDEHGKKKLISDFLTPC